MSFLSEVVTPPEWMRDALCQEYPTVNFHPTRGDDVRPAQRVCSRCLVRVECGLYSMPGDGEPWPGIWGGMSQRERKQVRPELVVALTRAA